MTRALLFGLLFTGVGLITIITFFISVKDSIKVMGTVIDYETQQSAKGTVYFPIIQFTHNGETLTMPTSVGDKKKKEQTGTTVEVYYKEGLNHVIRAKGSNELNTGIILTLCGVAMLVIGFIMNK